MALNFFQAPDDDQAHSEPLEKEKGDGVPITFSIRRHLVCPDNTLEYFSRVVRSAYDYTSSSTSFVLRMAFMKFTKM